MSDEGIYAPPRVVTDLSECSFYHITDLPGHGTVGWGWDLRGGEEEYLGGVDFRGKRVLELGTSSGFLCRYMESKGADVVGYDLSEEDPWDSVPFSQCDMTAYLQEMKSYLRLQSNAWWLAHRLLNSKSKVVYGHVGSIPAQIGPVDISTFGSILLHVRDPFLALQNALRLTRETVVVTDLHPAQPEDPPSAERRPAMRFLPNFRAAQPASSSSWWSLSPELVIEFLGVLGFETTRVSVHSQKYAFPNPQTLNLFTVVGTRTRDMVPLPSSPPR